MIAVKNFNMASSVNITSIDNARFRKPVVPGDVLRMEIDLLKVKLGIMKTHGVAKVDNEVVAEADMMFAFIDPPSLTK